MNFLILLLLLAILLPVIMLFLPGQSVQQTKKFFILEKLISPDQSENRMGVVLATPIFGNATGNVTGNMTDTVIVSVSSSVPIWLDEKTYTTIHSLSTYNFTCIGNFAGSLFCRNENNK